MGTVKGQHITLSHPQLGSIKGLVPISGVHQFRSVPYATIPHRFADPVVVESLGVEGTFDATKFGPVAPQPDDAEYQEFVTPKEHIPHEPLVQDEFKCANLNISVPTGERKDGEKGLPVMVWFHGGSFMLGAASWPQYDFAKFVKLSAERGQPVIGVGVNYRLGIIGFLASKELQETSPGNYGLKDQIASLEWVQKYIAGFGGDPKRVTIFGESVGGVAVNLHLMLKEGRFTRAIMQSGQAHLIGPKTIEFHEKMYSMVLETLKLDKTPKSARVEELRTMPLEKIMAVPPPEVMYQPCADGVLWKEVPYWDKLADPKYMVDKPDWAEAVIFGDCKDDGSIDMLYIDMHEDPCADFTACAYKYLSTSDAERLLSAYAIPPASKDATPIWQLCGDYAYNLPVIRAAAAWPRPDKCFVYHMERGNTFRDGPPFRGLATHMLDATYHFLNLNHSLSEKDQEVAIGMAERWIAFANGEDPWKAYGKERHAMCITDGCEFIVRTEEEDRKRPERRWSKWEVVLDIGVEKIWKIISVYHAQFDMDERKVSRSG